MTDMLFLKQR